MQTTGFQPLTEATPHRLLRHLLKSGFVRIDELGLGLDSDANGSCCAQMDVHFQASGRWACSCAERSGNARRFPKFGLLQRKSSVSSPRELRRIKYQHHGVVATESTTIGDMGMP